MAIINDVFVRLENQLTGDIYKKSIGQSPWIDLVKKSKWENGISDTQQVMSFERALPDDVETWAPVGINDGTGNTCVIPATQISFGSSTLSYSLAEKAVESPFICLKDVRNSYRFKEQLTNMQTQFTSAIGYVWRERARNEYVRLAQMKVLLNAQLGNPTSASSFALAESSSRLTDSHLRKFYQRLINLGAGADGSMGRENGRPIFTLITSAETSDMLMHDQKEVIMRSSRVNELLAPLGVEHSLRGYYHVIDDFAPRYNFVNGAWVRVQPLIKVTSAPGLEGTKFDINPAYETATHEDSIIYLPNVFEFLVPDELTSPGGNVTFDPQQYMGNVRWMNIRDREKNPDGNWGNYRAVMTAAAKPVRPEYGVVIRHLRCTVATEMAPCN